MTIEELKRKISSKGFRNSNEFWKNIGFSFEVIENAVKQFNLTSGAVKAGYGKLIIMEIWSIRDFLNEFGESIVEIDTLIPDLKRFRDAYAHVIERVKGLEKPFRSPEVPLAKEKLSIAGGSMTSNNNGGSWTITGGQIEMFNLNGAGGITSIFGIVNGYLICNTSTGLIELKIDQQFLQSLANIIENKL